mmetsp:Transcript_13359/g.44686  ORF Transcript_13359/g.44686 Transcript_13359/m.44686 type:complete len:250 (+) Transcript_13359:1004-1753(+)
MPPPPIWPPCCMGCIWPPCMGCIWPPCMGPPPLISFWISCSISRRALSACCCVGAVMVSVRHEASCSSGCGGMRMFVPVRSWTPRTVEPALPMTRPTLSFGILKLITGCVPPCDCCCAELRVRSMPSISSLARSTACGDPIMPMRRMATPLAPSGSASRAICRRHVVSAEMRLIFSPPRPITKPTMELGTRHSNDVSPALGRIGATSQAHVGRSPKPPLSRPKLSAPPPPMPMPPCMPMPPRGVMPPPP